MKGYSIFKKLAVGAAAAGISWICCLTPLALLFAGVTTASGALALDMVLYGSYDPAFILLGLAFLGALATYDLKRRNACNLNGLRTYRKNLIAMLGSMFVVYFLLYWVIEFLFITNIYTAAPPPPNDTLWPWDQVLYRFLHFLKVL
jgi:DMSO/TMAO reductase YedYZ heme-binding membrane subunit